MAPRPRGRTGWTLIRCAAAAAVVPRLVRTAAAHARDGSASSVEPPTSDGLPSISVVVPARDELNRIGLLLDAIATATAVVEVVVVDDGSIDGTATVARHHGARVVNGEPLPAGWAGKAWALDQGVRAATGEWVVCLDADTRPDPDLPSWLVAAAVERGIDLASVSGVASLPAAGRWLHAAMLATLVYRFGGPEATVAGRELVNGQCLAFRRSALLDEGGFGAVADAVVEDVGLARALARRGWTVRMLDAGDLLVVEPYASATEVVRGWSRSIGLPGVEPRGRVIVDVVVLALTMSLPFVRLVRRSADLLDALLIAMRLGTLIGMRRAYRAGGPAYWLSPVADPVAVVAVAVSPCRRSVRWRGRRMAVVAAR